MAARKRRFERSAFFFSRCEKTFFLLGCRIGRASRGLAALFQLLAGFVGALLQFLLQLLLVLLELLGIGRRAVIGLGEIAERQRQRHRLVVGRDRLNNKVLALL